VTVRNNIILVLVISHSGQLSLLPSVKRKMRTDQGAVVVLHGWEGNRRSDVVPFTSGFFLEKSQLPKISPFHFPLFSGAVTYRQWKLAGTEQASSRSAFGLMFNGDRAYMKFK